MGISCFLKADQKSQLQELLVEFFDLLTKHRFDVVFRLELKIELTPESPLLVYVQGSTSSNSRA